MKKEHKTVEDELEPEYDLKSLLVRRMGAQRQQFGKTAVMLEPDVALAFPNAAAVNEALRFLLRVTKENAKEITPQEAA